MKISAISPTVKILSDLKTKKLISAISGNYKEYKETSKQFATIAVKDFKAAKEAPCPSIKNVPLFSKVGLKMAKVWFLNLFRIKTPDEKLLKKMIEDDKAKTFIRLHSN